MQRKVKKTLSLRKKTLESLENEMEKTGHTASLLVDVAIVEYITRRNKEENSHA